MTNSSSHFPAVRPVASDRLAAMGKSAARLSETTGLSLTEAVVHTVGQEKLSAEQVRRVVECTNIEAFNQKYSSMSGDHRFVSLDGGPADPAQVLHALAAEPAADPGLGDYSCPPFKAASESIPVFREFRTHAGLIGDVLRLQSKLAAAHEIVVQDVSAAAGEMQEASDQLGVEVKRALCEGAERGELLASWTRVSPELAKIAGQRLLGEVALTKVANRVVNPEHPVVRTFAAFAKTAADYQRFMTARQGLEAELVRVGTWLKENGN